VNESENDDVVAEKLIVQQRSVALDIAGLLQGADAPQARRGRNTNSPGQVEIGYASIVLQLLQDVPVDIVKPVGHRKAPAVPFISRLWPEAKLYCASVELYFSFH
jgi:hypothetical protein